MPAYVARHAAASVSPGPGPGPTPCTPIGFARASYRWSHRALTASHAPWRPCMTVACWRAVRSAGTDAGGPLIAALSLLKAALKGVDPLEDARHALARNHLLAQQFFAPRLLGHHVAVKGRPCCKAAHRRLQLEAQRSPMPVDGLHTVHGAGTARPVSWSRQCGWDGLTVTVVP